MMIPLLAVHLVCSAPQRGIASWYGDHEAGRLMANGRRFHPAAMVAASPCLPFGARVLVTNLHNGRRVEVTIEDRGPNVRGRILDLSAGAAARLGMLHAGLVPVTVEAAPHHRKAKL
jgi:rare lipoprotein A